jgi:predicted ribonuclease YlaK
MRKNYVLDTNVLIHDPKSIFQFQDNNLFVPVYVLEELDKLKSEQSLRGRNSREACRILDDLRSQGSLSEGVKIGDGLFTIYVPKERRVLQVALDPKSMDSGILQAVLEIKERNPNTKTILVTMDVNLRVRAESIDIQTASYESQSVDASKMITGKTELKVGYGDIDKMFVDGKINLLESDAEFVYDNVCVMMVDPDGKTALGRYKKKENSISPLKLPKEGIMGIKPRNKDQQFAFDLLLDDSVKFVSLVGLAGTGKTLLATAVGLSKILDGTYSRLLISRPVMPMGKDIGFLPGPQPLDSKILTPDGWVNMGNLSIGDNVISRDGKPTKVLGIYPKGKKDIFRITTNDGSSTECCEDHLWLTKTKEQKKRNKSGSIKTTREIINTLTKNGKLNHYLPRNEPVEYKVKSLPIKPYTLGALLGDGSLCTSILLSNNDVEIAQRVNEEVKELNCYLSKPCGINYNIVSDIPNNKPARQIEITDTNTGEVYNYTRIGICAEKTDINTSTIYNRCTRNVTIDGYFYKFVENENRWSNPVKNAIYNLGLLGKVCNNKFIPDMYKYSSVEDRINLIRGLMDTDGTVKANGEASFTTTSLQLAKDVCEVVKSLGGRAQIKSRDRIGKKSIIKNRTISPKFLSYEFNISLPENLNPFFIERKRERFKCAYIYDARIKSIEFVGVKECQCILIENEEHLYLTDDFIVTHNTLLEKLDPYMQPIYDNLELLMMTSGKKKTNMKFEDLYKQDLIKVEPLTYIRGRSIPNQFLIVDEAQNLSPHELKTIITRCGDGTKIVLTGDPDQIDNPYMDKGSCGLSFAIEKLYNNPIVGHLTLSKGERSELANLAATMM